LTSWTSERGHVETAQISSGSLVSPSFNRPAFRPPIAVRFHEWS
jgi:hypothetical protein